MPVNKWILHIRDYAKRNKVTYSCALSDPKCLEEYKQKKLPIVELKEEPVEIKTEPEPTIYNFADNFLTKGISIRQQIRDALLKDNALKKTKKPRKKNKIKSQ